MLGEIECRRRRGWQRMGLLGGITDSKDVSLSKLLERVKDSGVWGAAVHGVTESDTTGRLNKSGRLRRVSGSPCLVPLVGGRCPQCSPGQPCLPAPGPFRAGPHSGQCQIHRQGRIFSCLFLQLKVFSSQLQASGGKKDNCCFSRSFFHIHYECFSVSSRNFLSSSHFLQGCWSC